LAKLKDIVAEIPQTSVKDMIKFFKREGITGKRCVCYECPISRYIKSRGIIASVTRGFITSTKKCMDTPKVFYHFLNEFDLGNIPQLEDK